VHAQYGPRSQIFSAGGGGNNASRKEKIQYKNEKLNNQRETARKKREEIKAKQQERQEKKAPKQGPEKKLEANSAVSSEAAAEVHGGMHPARLAQLQGSASRGRAARF
jgi:nucleolar protein 6